MWYWSTVDGVGLASDFFLPLKEEEEGFPRRDGAVALVLDALVICRSSETGSGSN